MVKAPVDAQKRKVGYPGDYISDEVIRFEKGRGDKLFVREISYLEHSADTLGMYQAVLNSNVQPIVATFPLKTVRKEGETTNYVIDMTDYIRKDNEMFSFTSRVKDNIGASSMVDDASYIDTLKAFPQTSKYVPCVPSSGRKEEAVDLRNCWQLSLPPLPLR